MEIVSFKEKRISNSQCNQTWPRIPPLLQLNSIKTTVKCLHCLPIKICTVAHNFKINSIGIKKNYFAFIALATTTADASSIYVIYTTSLSLFFNMAYNILK